MDLLPSDSASLDGAVSCGCRSSFSGAALVLCLVQPAAAFFWDKKESPSAVPDFSKNCLAGESISFTQEDFAQASAITLSTLPDPGTGTLTLGGQPLSAGSVIEASALAGLTFQCAAQPSADTATFTFTAAFSGQAGQSEPTTVTLKDRTKRNGSLLYTIRPLADAREHYLRQQLQKNERRREFALSAR